MRQSISTYTVSDLIWMIDQGVLGLPDFQRDFVWEPQHVAALLDSVGRGWPIGTLILVPPTPDLASRPIEGAPSLRDELRFVVLDGQQRLTALYQAISDVGPARFRVNPDRESEKDNLFDWVSRTESEETDRVAERQLLEYQVPCVVLDPDVELYELAQIFEAINTRGVPIDTFDLANARVGSIGESLRSTWSEYRESNFTLDSFHVSPTEILRLVALKYRIEGHSRVRGLRASDILEIPADDIARLWPKALKAYSETLRVLQDRAGLVEASDIPSTRAVLLAASASSLNGDVDADMMLRRYWNTVLRRSDLTEAETIALASSGEQLQSERSVRFDDVLLTDLTRSGARHVVKAVRGLARLDDALDPFDGESLRGREVREFEYLPGWGIERAARPETPLGRTLLVSLPSALHIRKWLQKSSVVPQDTLMSSALRSQGFRHRGPEGFGSREATLRRWILDVVDEIV